MRGTFASQYCIGKAGNTFFPKGAVQSADPSVEINKVFV